MSGLQAALQREGAQGAPQIGAPRTLELVSKLGFQRGFLRVLCPCGRALLLQKPEFVTGLHRSQQAAHPPHGGQAVLVAAVHCEPTGSPAGAWPSRLPAPGAPMTPDQSKVPCLPLASPSLHAIAITQVTLSCSAALFKGQSFPRLNVRGQMTPAAWLCPPLHSAGRRTCPPSFLWRCFPDSDFI